MFEHEKIADRANGTTGQFVLIEKAKSPEDKKLEPEAEELEFEEELGVLEMDHFVKLNEDGSITDLMARGAAAGGQENDKPYDEEGIVNDIGQYAYQEGEEGTYSFENALIDIYDNGLPTMLDASLVNFLKNEMWGWERYGRGKQPWRENGFVFYRNGKFNVRVGNNGLTFGFDKRILNREDILMVGHSHSIQAIANDEDGSNGIFVRKIGILGNEVWAICDAGIPSGNDFTAAEDEKEYFDPRVPIILVGEQYIVFYNENNTYAVYDIDTGKKVGIDIDWTDNVTIDKNTLIRGLYEFGLKAIELKIDENHSKSYDVYGGGVTHIEPGEVVPPEQPPEQPEPEEEKTNLILEEGATIKRQLWLMDDERNLYPIETVSGLTPQYSADKYDIDIPEPWIIDEDFNVIKQGAKVLITFPAGRENPVVMGCLQTFGGQVNYPLGSRVGIGALSVKKSSRSIGKCTFEKFEDESGRKENIINGGYSLNVDKGSIYQGTDKTHTIEGEELLNLMGDYIDIGGKSRQDYEDEDVLKNKAKEMYLNSKKIFLGFSNLRILQDKQIKIDDTDEIDDPKLQPLVMAYVLVTLLEDLIDKLLAARYIGPNGVSRMVDTDKKVIELEVKNKLPNMISEITYLLKNPEIVSNES